MIEEDYLALVAEQLRADQMDSSLIKILQKYPIDPNYLCQHLNISDEYIFFDSKNRLEVLYKSDYKFKTLFILESKE